MHKIFLQQEVTGTGSDRNWNSTRSDGTGAKKQSRIRKLTPLECLRLQGFPDEFYYRCKKEGLSDTQLYKQAGNSMTSDVMYYLIKEILKNGY